MNRRQFLMAGGGTVVAVAGGTAAAAATRADISLDEGLTRGQGDPVKIKRTRSSVEYLESANAVRESGEVETEPFGEWARRECGVIGAETILSVVDERIDGPVESVGRGLRYLLFGPVVAVSHTVHRNRDGAVLSEPNVSLERLVAVAPRTMTVTVTVEGQAHTTEVPVGVEHVEVSNL